MIQVEIGQYGSDRAEHLDRICASTVATQICQPTAAARVIRLGHRRRALLERAMHAELVDVTAPACNESEQWCLRYGARGLAALGFVEFVTRDQLRAEFREAGRPFTPVATGVRNVARMIIRITPLGRAAYRHLQRRGDALPLWNKFFASTARRLAREEPTSARGLCPPR